MRQRRAKRFVSSQPVRNFFLFRQEKDFGLAEMANIPVGRSEWPLATRRDDEADLMAVAAKTVFPRQPLGHERPGNTRLEGKFAMNSLVPLRIRRAGPNLALYAALAKLGEYIDAETACLHAICAQVEAHEADDAINALGQLHLGAECRSADIRRVLVQAKYSLEQMSRTLSKLPARFDPEPALQADFDAAVNYHGARLDEITRTLQRAIRA